MELIQAKDYQDMSQRACSLVLERLRGMEDPVLGLATGSTPEGMYNCLIEAYRKGEASFNNLTTFNLDEYVGLKKEHPKSYHSYMKEKLFKHINIGEDQIHLPNGTAVDLDSECLEYEKLIKNAGKIDLQILGIGLNGHIGFNEPGTSFESRTHMVELDESTRKANARFFSSIEEVPKKAVTMGIGTILDSKEIILLVSGKNKAAALARLLKGEVSESFPASALGEHPNTIIIADESSLNS
ncbi:glucosamine-6-phosphate deaminase [Virgibacillus sediminis]|uniref:Glucosamine-6-phosphate deaminase n=1 Tax=Virgibacillus sediminis TaxID=202260 RepID=A0ABV7A6U2_9BACI